MLFATLLALASAGLHAAWNLFVKTSEDRELAAWGQWIAGGLLFLPVPVVRRVARRRRVAVPVRRSSVIHVAYIYALVSAYHHGDFSLAYPLARGGGALVAAVLGAVFLSDSLALRRVDRVARRRGRARVAGAAGRAAAEIGFALLTAVMIGWYTVVDTAGSRHTDDGFAYAVRARCSCRGSRCRWSRSRAGVVRDLVATLPAQWWRYLMSGACLTAAYGLVLIAVQHAPVGYVATLRESSVVIGALLGWLLLKEPLGGRRLRSSIIVTIGLVALVIFR